jgi:hypothetical protein
MFSVENKKSVVKSCRMRREAVYKYANPLYKYEIEIFSNQL